MREIPWIGLNPCFNGMVLVDKEAGIHIKINVLILVLMEWY